MDMNPSLPAHRASDLPTKPDLHVCIPHDGTPRIPEPVSVCDQKKPADVKSWDSKPVPKLDFRAAATAIIEQIAPGKAAKLVGWVEAACKGGSGVVDLVSKDWPAQEIFIRCLRDPRFVEVVRRESLANSGAVDFAVCSLSADDVPPHWATRWRADERPEPCRFAWQPHEYSERHRRLADMIAADANLTPHEAHELAEELLKGAGKLKRSGGCFLDLRPAFGWLREFHDESEARAILFKVMQQKSVRLGLWMYGADRAMEDPAHPEWLHVRVLWPVGTTCGEVDPDARTGSGDRKARLPGGADFAGGNSFDDAVRACRMSFNLRRGKVTVMDFARLEPWWYSDLLAQQRDSKASLADSEYAKEAQFIVTWASGDREVSFAGAWPAKPRMKVFEATPHEQAAMCDRVEQHLGCSRASAILLTNAILDGLRMVDGFDPPQTSRCCIDAVEVEKSARSRFKKHEDPRHVEQLLARLNGAWGLLFDGPLMAGFVQPRLISAAGQVLGS